MTNPTTLTNEVDGDGAAPWWTQTFRMMQTNLREIDATLDVEAVLDALEAHGADAWLLNGGGILSFYPSELPFQTPNPYLEGRASGDLLGDALVACRRRGVRLLARMDFSKVEGRIAAQHPDWTFVSATGKRQVYNGLVSVCPSAPYYQEHTFKVLTELCERYPVDGFFINWMSFNEFDYSGVEHGTCHCRACVTAFADFAPGTALPRAAGDPGYLTWRAFAAETIDTLTARLRAHIRALLPDAGLILGQKADIMFHEANAKVGREYWPHATSVAVSRSKSRRPAVPVLVNAAVFLDMPYRYAPVNDDHYALYLIQTMARGGVPSTYTMGTPSAAPFSDLGIAGALTRYHRDHDRTYRGLRQAASTLLVSGERARLSSSWTDAADEEMRGVYEALLRAHVPVDVGDVENLDELARPERLEQYDVLVLCNVGQITDAAAAALDDWVRSGGALVSIGASALRDDLPQMATSPVSRRIAVVTDPLALLNTYVATATPGVGDGYDRLAPILGAHHYMEYVPDCERRYTILAQVPFGPPEKCYGTLPIDFPGVALRAVGSGHHAVLPWLPGIASRTVGAEGAGHLLAALVTELHGHPLPVTTDLPEDVELVVAHNDDGLVVHLVNYTGARRATMGPAVPVVGGHLYLSRGDDVTARALLADEVCPVEPVDGGMRVTLPTIGRFETIQFTAGEHGG